MPTDERQRNQGQFDQIVVALLILTLLVGTAAYFVVALSPGIPEAVEGFVLDILGNLLPILIVGLISYFLLRSIVAADEERRVTRSAERVAGLLDDQLGVVSEEIAAFRNILEARLVDLENKLPGLEQNGSPVQRVSGDVVVEGHLVDEEVAQYIGTVIHATVLALFYGRPQSRSSVRIFCHLVDRQNEVLRPLCKWSEHQSDDYNALIPLSGRDSEPFVISRAFNETRMVAADLAANHNEQYPPSLQDRILPTLRCVIAAPICSFEPNDESVFGTLSIDSTAANLEEIGFDDQEFKDSLSGCARTIHRYLVISRRTRQNGLR